MATINVKDAAGSTVALEKPLTPGQAAMAASRPVVVASDQSTIPVSLASVPSHAVTNAGTFAVQATLQANSGVDIGKLTANQSTNVAQINAVTPLMGNGVTGTGSQRVTIASDNTAFAVNAAATQSGTWTVQPGNTANTTAWKVDGSAVTQPVSLTSTTVTGTVAVTESGTWTVQPGNTANTTPWLAKLHDGTNAVAVKAASTAPQATDPALVVAISPNSVNANGQTTMSASAPTVIASNQSWPTGMSPRGISAAFTTLTRPANTTAYSAADSISDNATAGSVTALSATLSDTNDDPVTITEILVNSTDTGLAGKRIRAYLFNSDPTASTGVGGGDNAAYSQKKAGYIGSMSGVLETGFSDGTVGRLTPSYNDGAAASTPNAAAGGFIVTKPTSGAKTIFIQYQAIDGFTPSANSTTIIGTARGFQGRAS